MYDELTDSISKSAIALAMLSSTEYTVLKPTGKRVGDIRAGYPRTGQYISCQASPRDASNCDNITSPCVWLGHECFLKTDAGRHLCTYFAYHFSLYFGTGFVTVFQKLSPNPITI